MKIVIAAVLCALLLGCGEPEKPIAEAELRPVRVVIASQNGVLRERAFSGIAQSTQASRLSFRVSGTVVELPVQVGDKLSRGGLIARLNKSVFDLAVQQAEASLAQALANQRNADASYSRMKELYENNNASRNDLDSGRANSESAEAQVRSARKSLELAELDRSYTRLTASGDCTVASLDMELNENVNAGTPVAQINCGEGIEVRLGVPESLIGGLAQGMVAQVRFSAISGRSFSGKITELGVAAGGSAATFPVVVALAQTDVAIRPSMAAEVVFEFRSDASEAHIIPAVAVINDERGSFVYVAIADKDDIAVVERRPVAIGELRSEGIEILEGLADGDIVITAGTTVIREGQTVLLPQD